MSGLRIGVLASGSGSNLQSILDAVENNTLESEVVCILSNKEDAYCLERGKKHNVPTYFINHKADNYDEKMLEILGSHDVDLIVLAGYLKIISPEMVKRYPKKIINIHPSLLPKYGGKGYYGIRVHEAVIEAGDTESGATVHYVDCGVDTGDIILQQTVSVYEEDTPQMLQQRVLEEVEHKILVQAVRKLEVEGL